MACFVQMKSEDLEGCVVEFLCEHFEIAGGWKSEERTLQVIELLARGARSMNWMRKRMILKTNRLNLVHSSILEGEE